MTGSVGAVEIGGSHVATARIDVVDGLPRAGEVTRLPLRAAGERDELLETIVAAARAVREPMPARWGVAVPGPFDYDRGISLIRGAGKLEAIHGTDLRQALAGALGAPPASFSFLNDADAFLIGEAWAGAARRCRRAVGITLGTGLGSAFLADGRIVVDGPGVPPEGRFDLLHLDGRPVEATVSGRGLLDMYRGIVEGEPRAGFPDGAAGLAVKARAGDRAAGRAFDRFGEALGRVVAPWLAAFAPDCLVVGGSIARAWDLFGPGFRRRCPPLPGIERCEVAHHLDTAALFGAARHAAALAEGAEP